MKCQYNFKTACFFNLFLEVSHIRSIRALMIQSVKNNLDLETCRKSWKFYFPKVKCNSKYTVEGLVYYFFKNSTNGFLKTSKENISSFMLCHLRICICFDKRMMLKINFNTHTGVKIFIKVPFEFIQAKTSRYSLTLKMQ